ncbi:MAG: signal peptidase I [Planctomycetota bacterium]|nr:signal peptidase I [Planctomycetota bacterium]
MAKRKDAGATTPTEGAKSPPVPGWRSGLDFIGMLGGAVLVALLIKAYAFDVYLIPSGSMETALHGRPDGGDRIFCSKFNYRFRQPERWEVAVFEFPYESARKYDPRDGNRRYEGQNFVKRIVGLPGETVAISRGDIWAHGGRGSEYRRIVKPDSVQRGMWLGVYEEDFGDILLPELERSWKILGGGVGLERGGPLVLHAAEESVRMDYRPQVPAGSKRDRMAEMPGVPDRYVLEQPVQFRCDSRLEDGTVCGQVFVKNVRTQDMQARCPACGALLDETAAIFYHRRSGLPAVGRYGVNPQHAPQGEYEVDPRQTDYHIVPDLRLVVDVTLAEEGTAVALAIREDSRFVQAVARGDGLVEIQVNGEPSRMEHRAVAALRPGRRHRIEFYVVDGTARVFVDGAAEAVLDAPVWNDRKAMPRNVPRASGTTVAATGGTALIHGIRIDRDVFYYSGLESGGGMALPAMNARGEMFVNEDAFFPMGDHCPSSFDARSWGPVPLSLLRGPALFIWWPPERIGRIPRP